MKLGMMDMFKNVGKIGEQGMVPPKPHQAKPKQDMALPNALCGCQSTQQMQPFDNKFIFG